MILIQKQIASLAFRTDCLTLKSFNAEGIIFYVIGMKLIPEAVFLAVVLLHIIAFSGGKAGEIIGRAAFLYILRGNVIDKNVILFLLETGIFRFVKFRQIIFAWSHLKEPFSFFPFLRHACKIAGKIRTAILPLEEQQINACARIPFKTVALACICLINASLDKRSKNIAVFNIIVNVLSQPGKIVKIACSSFRKIFTDDPRRHHAFSFFIFLQLDRLIIASLSSWYCKFDVLRRPAVLLGFSSRFLPALFHRFCSRFIFRKIFLRLTFFRLRLLLSRWKGGKRIRKP